MKFKANEMSSGMPLKSKPGVDHSRNNTMYTCSTQRTTVILRSSSVYSLTVALPSSTSSSGQIHLLDQSASATTIHQPLLIKTCESLILSLGRSVILNVKCIYNKENISCTGYYVERPTVADGTPAPEKPTLYVMERYIEKCKNEFNVKFLGTEKRSPLDAEDRVEVAKSYERLLQGLRVASAYELFGRLEDIATKMNLTFVRTPGTANNQSCFITADCFFLEISAEETGSVFLVNVTHEKQTSESVLLRDIINDKRWTELQRHLWGLCSAYIPCKDIDTKNQAFKFMQNLENILHIQSLQRINENTLPVVEYLRTSDMYFFRRREVGDPPRLYFFCTPLSFWDSETGDFKQLFQNDIDNVMDVSKFKSIIYAELAMENVQGEQFLSISMQSVSALGQFHDIPLSMQIAAVFTLTFPEKLIISMDSVTKIEALTGFKPAFSNQSKILDLILGEILSSGFSVLRSFVLLEDQLHCYTVDLEGCLTEGVVLEKIYWTNLEVLHKILPILRTEALFKHIFTSFIRNITTTQKQFAQKIFRRDIHVIPSPDLSILECQVKLPREREFFYIVFRLAPINEISVKVGGVVDNADVNLNDVAYEVFSRVWSIPVTIRALVKQLLCLSERNVVVAAAGDGNSGNGDHQNDVVLMQIDCDRSLHLSTDSNCAAHSSVSIPDGNYNMSEYSVCNDDANGVAVADDADDDADAVISVSGIAQSLIIEQQMQKLIVNVDKVLEELLLVCSGRLAGGPNLLDLFKKPKVWRELIPPRRCAGRRGQRSRQQMAPPLAQQCCASAAGQLPAPVAAVAAAAPFGKVGPNLKSRHFSSTSETLTELDELCQLSSSCAEGNGHQSEHASACGDSAVADGGEQKSSIQDTIDSVLGSVRFPGSMAESLINISSCCINNNNNTNNSNPNSNNSNANTSNNNNTNSNNNNNNNNSMNALASIRKIELGYGQSSAGVAAPMSSSSSPALAAPMSRSSDSTGDVFDYETRSTTTAGMSIDQGGRSLSSSVCCADDLSIAAASASTPTLDVGFWPPAGGVERLDVRGALLNRGMRRRRRCRKAFANTGDRALDMVLKEMRKAERLVRGASSTRRPRRSRLATATASFTADMREVASKVTLKIRSSSAAALPGVQTAQESSSLAVASSSLSSADQGSSSGGKDEQKKSLKLAANANASGGAGAATLNTWTQPSSSVFRSLSDATGESCSSRSSSPPPQLVKPASKRKNSLDVVIGKLMDKVGTSPTKLDPSSDVPDSAGDKQRHLYGFCFSPTASQQQKSGTTAASVSASEFTIHKRGECSTTTAMATSTGELSDAPEGGIKLVIKKGVIKLKSARHGRGAGAGRFVETGAPSARPRVSSPASAGDRLAASKFELLKQKMQARKIKRQSSTEKSRQRGPRSGALAAASKTAANRSKLSTVGSSSSGVAELPSVFPGAEGLLFSKSLKGFKIPKIDDNSSKTTTTTTAATVTAAPASTSDSANTTTTVTVSTTTTATVVPAAASAAATMTTTTTTTNIVSASAAAAVVTSASTVATGTTTSANATTTASVAVTPLTVVEKRMADGPPMALVVNDGRASPAGVVSGGGGGILRMKPPLLAVQQVPPPCVGSSSKPLIRRSRPVPLPLPPRSLVATGPHFAGPPAVELALPTGPAVPRYVRRTLLPNPPLQTASSPRPPPPQPLLELNKHHQQQMLVHSTTQQRPTKQELLNPMTNQMSPKSASPDPTGLVIDDNLNTTAAISSPQKNAEEVDVLSPGLRIAVDEGDETKGPTTHSSSTT
ncbi:Mediator of RNA polymerase II transcription subunit 1 [Trichinella sp. T8]|nr:Mediator of RNA polymerase II transcription subunit 1 [Trichinella sp. T8]